LGFNSVWASRGRERKRERGRKKQKKKTKSFSSPIALTGEEEEELCRLKRYYFFLKQNMKKCRFG